MAQSADDTGDLFDDDLPDDASWQPPTPDGDSELVIDLDAFEIRYPGDLGSRPYSRYDDQFNSDEDFLIFRTPHGYLDLVRGEWYSDLPPEPVIIECDIADFQGDNHPTIEFDLDGDEWKSGDAWNSKGND